MRNLPVALNMFPMPTLIFVHGACVRDAAWWWDKMTEPLTERGITRGLKPAERETYSNGVRKVLYRDPDGNEVGFAGGPINTA